MPARCSSDVLGFCAKAGTVKQIKASIVRIYFMSLSPLMNDIVNVHMGRTMRVQDFASQFLSWLIRCAHPQQQASPANLLFHVFLEMIAQYFQKHDTDRCPSCGAADRGCR